MARTFSFDFAKRMIYNAGLTPEMEFEWDEGKRQKILAERNLDIAVLGPAVFDDLGHSIEPDERIDYGEQRLRAYGKVGDSRLCLCFTPRNEKIRLITIFKIKEKVWRKHYVKND